MGAMLTGQPSISKVAEFLGAGVDSVSEMLAEGRLGGALIVALRGRGVSVTPGVRNAVDQLIRTIEPPSTEPPASEPMTAGGTATIVFTDIVDSTGLLERMGDRRASAIMALQDNVVTSHAHAYGGMKVKSLGDGSLLAFNSVSTGVACALDSQATFLGMTPTRGAPEFLVRIGVSVGEPVRDREDFLGRSVNMAARIMSKADGGQVLVSRLAMELVAGAREFVFKPVGPFELKGFEGSHTLYEVTRASP